MIKVERYTISGVQKNDPDGLWVLHSNYAALLDERDNFQADWIDAITKLAAAENERDAYKMDAERYRWLRYFSPTLAVCDENTTYYGMELDAAIDAALADGGKT